MRGSEAGSACGQLVLWRRLAEPHQPRDAPGTGLPRPMRRLGRVSTGEAPAQPSASAALSSRLSKTRSIWCAAESSFTCHTPWVAGWVGGLQWNGAVALGSGALGVAHLAAEDAADHVDFDSVAHAPRPLGGEGGDAGCEGGDTGCEAAEHRRRSEDVCGRGRWRAMRPAQGGTSSGPA